MDGEEGVGAFDALAVVGTNADALAEAAKLVCIRGVLNGGESGVSTELAPLEEVARGFVKTQCCLVVGERCVGPVGDEGGRVPTAEGMGRCDGIG